MSAPSAELISIIFLAKKPASLPKRNRTQPTVVLRQIQSIEGFRGGVHKISDECGEFVGVYNFDIFHTGGLLAG
jgi:hypothetical protein